MGFFGDMGRNLSGSNSSGGTQTEDDTGRPLHILTGRCRWHQGAVKNIRT